MQTDPRAFIYTPPAGLPLPPNLSGALPEWVILGGALLVLGFVAEVLYKASPMSAYLFVLILLMGYAAVGERLGAVQGFVAQVTGHSAGAGSGRGV